jgi:hypothetical protein
MAVTKIDELRAPQSRAYVGTSLPTLPYQYYDAGSNDVDSVEWRGGEMAYLTTDNRFYIQQATSGTTAEWYRFLDATAAD